jgi:hypothetical protein
VIDKHNRSKNCRRGLDNKKRRRATMQERPEWFEAGWIKDWFAKLGTEPFSLFNKQQQENNSQHYSSQYYLHILPVDAEYQLASDSLKSMLNRHARKTEKIMFPKKKKR